jgi:hypothetical protein
MSPKLSSKVTLKTKFLIIKRGSSANKSWGREITKTLKGCYKIEISGLNFRKAKVVSL